VLSLEGSRRFSASCSSTLQTLPASVIDIVLVPTRGPTMELSMRSLLWPQVRDVRENMSLRQRSFQWFLEKAIEERSVEFGCVDGEAEEGGRSGGNGAHLGAVVQTRSTEKQAVNAHPFSGAPRFQPTYFLPSLNICRRTSQASKMGFISTMLSHRRRPCVPSSKNPFPQPRSFNTGLAKVSTTRTRSPPPRLLGGAVPAVMNL
jgi:hypothetical protein